MKSYTDLFHYDWSMKNWCDTNDYTYALEYVLKKTTLSPPSSHLPVHWFMCTLLCLLVRSGWCHIKSGSYFMIIHVHVFKKELVCVLTLYEIDSCWIFFLHFNRELGYDLCLINSSFFLNIISSFKSFKQSFTFKKKVTFRNNIYLITCTC